MNDDYCKPFNLDRCGFVACTALLDGQVTMLYAFELNTVNSTV